MFLAKAASQKAILEVRELCENACSSITGLGVGEDAISLLHVDPDTTYTLELYEEAQFQQTKKARGKLEDLRKKVLAIVKEACEVRVQRTKLMLVGNLKKKLHGCRKT